MRYICKNIDLGKTISEKTGMLLRTSGHPGVFRFLSYLAIPLLCCSLHSGCTPAPLWISPDYADPIEIMQFLEGKEAKSGILQSAPRSFPAIPMRMRLRPCCTLGETIETTTAGIERSPWSIVDNIRSISTLGTHTYDSGALRANVPRTPVVLSNEENNGLVYTCRGGFIDTAQVRDYADWTVYLANRFGRRMSGGHVLQIPRMGGVIEIRVKKVPRKMLEHYGRRRLAVLFAKWTAGKLALWHEIATWYGWSVLPDYSERSSAFSPEDLYSKMLGIKLGAALTLRNRERNEAVYNKSMTAWLEEVLKHLGAVERQPARAAVFDVKGIWWSDPMLIGDAEYLLRRNMDIGEKIVPWLVKPRSPWLTKELRRRCGPDPQPAILPNPETVDKIRFSEWIEINITVDDRIARHAPFQEMGKHLNEQTLETVLESVRNSVYARFGSESDQPYPPDQTPSRRIPRKKPDLKTFEKPPTTQDTVILDDAVEDKVLKEELMEEEPMEEEHMKDDHVEEEPVGEDHVNEHQIIKGHIKEKQKNKGDHR